FAFARAAVARGAEVVLVAANTDPSLTVPAGVKVVPVVSTAEMRDVMLAAATDADAVVMAAAPADFRPVTYTEHKIKKAADGSAPTIELTQNPDILAELARARTRAGVVIVGFASETGDADADVLEHGRRKLVAKGADLLVVNEVGPA